MREVRWGIIGCGDVVEVKSGPAFQRANGSSLLAVTRRDRARAEDFARRHGVPRVHATADALVTDREVDAVYIATPPSSHHSLALKAAMAGKPCLVEKPMATTHAECLDMVAAFARRSVPLWVAYYRRALPRFLKIRELLDAGAIGRVTSAQVEVLDILPGHDQSGGWRVDPGTAGAGLFFDVGSHGLDMLDFLIGPITTIAGVAENTGGAYTAEDVTAASFLCGDQVPGTGLWNFNAARKEDTLTIRGTSGAISTSMFTDADVLLSRGDHTDVFPIRNPAYVHQPLIQNIVDELLGRGRCASTGESGARTSWALEQCIASYYDKRQQTSPKPLSTDPIGR